MALSVTSAPFQQVNMPALDLRRYLSAAFVEGVVGATDMVVAQRGAGANMSVDISSGQALIQGDAITNQGLYYAYNDAVSNLTGFSAANATNPRIDRVTLRVRDQFHGDAANDISFQIVTGTATAGATLTNLNGAAAVPTSSLLLANVLIPATATTITTANIDTTVRVSTAGGWQSYTPTLTGSTGGSPALGNATMLFRWSQVGKTARVHGQMILGSSTVLGTGDINLSLPVAQASGVLGVLGLVHLFDASANSIYTASYADTGDGLSKMRFVYTASAPGAPTQVGPTTPFTWATGDNIIVWLAYEVA